MTINNPKRRFKKPYLYNILRRQRLNSLLKQQAGRKLTIVYGKAGSGKSILVSDFINEGKSGFLWINMEETDRDADNLADILAWGIKEYLQINDTENNLISLFEKITDNFVLILDNFHFLDKSRENNTFIESFLEDLPGNISVYILSRETVNFSLSRLRSRQELLVLTESDLRFTIEEITNLIKDVFQLTIEDSIITKLDDILKGWITGYIFLIDQLSNMTNAEEQRQYVQTFVNKGNREAYFDFFDTEVMNRFSKCEKNILISLSPFGTISPELGMSIGGKEGYSCLKEIIQNSNFIEKDQQSADSYRFHPVFSDYLNTLFLEMPEDRQTTLLKKAIPFFREKNDVQNLIPVLLKLGDIEEAKKFFVSYAEEILDLTQHKKIRGLLKSFPLKNRKDDPLLVYYSALAMNLERPFTTRQQLFQLLKHFKESGDIDRQARIYSTLLANFLFYQESREAVEEIVDKASSFLKAVGDKVSPEKKEILLSLLPLGKNWAGADREESFENALRAEETSFKLNNKEAFLCSRLVLSQNYLQSGEFEASKRVLTQTWNMLEDNHLFHPYSALLKFYMGDAEFYSGNIHKAIQHVQEGLNISSPDFAFRPYLEVDLILYNLYLNNIDQAEKLFETIREEKTGENLYLNYYRVYLLQMLIAYRNKNWRRASYYSSRLLEEGNESLLLTDYPYSFTDLIEVNLALENYETVENLLSAIKEDVSEENFPFSAATISGLEILYNIRTGKDISEPKARLTSLLAKHNFENLDICDPNLLEEICEVADIESKDRFQRLKSINITSDLKKTSYDLDIYTLGNFRIFIKGKEIPSSKLLSQKRVMDLLKLLIIYRKNGIHKDTIYETFWPKYSYKSARDNLNTIIYRLRNIFGKSNNFLSTDVSTIGFLPNIVRTDVDSFTKFCSLGERALKEDETGDAIEMFKEAVMLYKGDFLEGDLYSDFIGNERESLRRMYLGTLFKLAKLFLDTGDYMQALEVLQLFNKKEPLYEPATRLFMITSTLIGNRSIIPRIFDNLDTQLRETYNIGPDRKTIDLKDRLIEGDNIPREVWDTETFI